MIWPLAIGVGLSCVVAQVILAYLFARVLPEGPWRKQPGFLAHQIIGFPIMIIVTALGFRAWFFPDADEVAAAATPEGRIHSYYQTSDVLVSLLLGELVMWDIPMTFYKSLYSVASMGHHVGMAITATIALKPYMMYYVPFFAGVIELSSIPLQIVDICHPKHFPEFTENPTIAAINGVARNLFAVFFLLTRTIYFPYVVLLQVLPDLWKVGIGAPALEVVAALAGASLALAFTALQLFWSNLIIKQIIKAFKKGGDEIEPSRAASPQYEKIRERPKVLT